jgi:hypothetical protein
MKHNTNSWKLCNDSPYREQNEYHQLNLDVSVDKVQEKKNHSQQQVHPHLGTLINTYG